MPNFQKNERFYPLIRTRTCAYQGVKNLRFSENLACLVFLLPPFWDSLFYHITDDLLQNDMLSFPMQNQNVTNFLIGNEVCELDTYITIYQILKFNLFHSNVPFLYDLRTSENLLFSDVFGRYRIGTMAWNGLWIIVQLGFPKIKKSQVQQVLNDSHYI